MVSSRTPGGKYIESHPKAHPEGKHMLHSRTPRGKGTYIVLSVHPVLRGGGRIAAAPRTLNTLVGPCVSLLACLVYGEEILIELHLGKVIFIVRCVLLEKTATQITTQQSGAAVGHGFHALTNR